MSKPITTRFTIVGAGAGGLCAGIKLLESDQSDFLIFDREPRVGGTWQRNTYPGLECDIASPLYCYSFAPKSGLVEPVSAARRDPRLPRARRLRFGTRAPFAARYGGRFGAVERAARAVATRARRRDRSRVASS